MKTYIKTLSILVLILTIQNQRILSQQTVEFYNGTDSIFIVLNFDSIPTSILIDKSIFFNTQVPAGQRTNAKCGEPAGTKFI